MGACILYLFIYKCVCACRCQCVYFGVRAVSRDLHRRRPGGAICTVSQFVNRGPRCVCIIHADWCTRQHELSMRAPRDLCMRPICKSRFVAGTRATLYHHVFVVMLKSTCCVAKQPAWQTPTARGARCKMNTAASCDGDASEQGSPTSPAAAYSAAAPLDEWSLLCVCEWASCFLLGSAHTMMLLRSQTVISLWSRDSHAALACN